MEKALWVKNYFGLEVQKKLILCCNKSLVKGHYLIDDSISDGQQEFEGELIRFGTTEFPNWDSVVRHIFNVEGEYYPN
jgi:5'(3')-deoxyribonucleotidase